MCPRSRSTRSLLEAQRPRRTCCRCAQGPCASYMSVWSQVLTPRSAACRRARSAWRSGALRHTASSCQHLLTLAVVLGGECDRAWSTGHRSAGSRQLSCKGCSLCWLLVDTLACCLPDGRTKHSYRRAPCHLAVKKDGQSPAHMSLQRIFRQGNPAVHIHEWPQPKGHWQAPGEQVMEHLLHLAPHVETGVALHCIHAFVPARLVCSGMRTEI